MNAAFLHRPLLSSPCHPLRDARLGATHRRPPHSMNNFPESEPDNLLPTRLFSEWAGILCNPRRRPSARRGCAPGCFETFSRQPAHIKPFRHDDDAVLP
jgi:hypothetical protein